MKTYEVALDIIRIRKLLNLSQSEFADRIGVSRSNVARYEKGDVFPSAKVLEAIYSFAYEEAGIRLNPIKAQFLKEDPGILLFHGARGEIVGEVDTHRSVPPNDFGNGFYAGETLEQAATWVCTEKVASVYCFRFSPKESLKSLSFGVNREWMNAILYYRGAFRDRELPREIADLVNRIEESDYLIAPIADNNMYQTLSSFVEGEITDEACIHALSMTDLGMQYVFKSEAALRYLKCEDRFYLCQKEKADYMKIRTKGTEEGENKSKLAKIEYRRKGSYFDEIYKRR